jgi:hypothetical protein
MGVNHGNDKIRVSLTSIRGFGGQGWSGGRFQGSAGFGRMLHPEADS